MRVRNEMHKVLMNSQYQKTNSNILKWCVEEEMNYLVPRCESVQSVFLKNVWILMSTAHWAVGFIVLRFGKLPSGSTLLTLTARSDFLNLKLVLNEIWRRVYSYPIVVTPNWVKVFFFPNVFPTAQTLTESLWSWPLFLLPPSPQ